MANAFGTITLMGSGELTEHMSRAHRLVLARVQGAPNAVFLDTPAGFETNVDEISARAQEYFSRHLGVPLQIASFKHRERAEAGEIAAALGILHHANFIFAGPGSPSYALRHWKGSAVWDAVCDRFANGAHLVFASAAALTTGRWTLPVYEIFKVGADPYWLDGLDLCSSIGLNLAVVPHWNNSEGQGFDSRYCFMGAARMEELMRHLYKDTAILGIDEYTACTLDPIAQTGTVIGAGVVTVRSNGQGKVYPSDTTFSFEQLRAETANLPTENSVSNSIEMRQIASAPGEAERYLSHLVQALPVAQTPDEKITLVEQAHSVLHELSRQSPGSPASSLDKLTESLLDLVIDTRAKLRQAGQYALADEMRERLAAVGVALVDDGDLTTWHQVSEYRAGA